MTAGTNQHTIASDMEPNQNKATVSEYVAAFNRGDIPGVCACFTADAVIYGVLGWGGLDKARPIWEQLVRSMQMQLQIDSIAAEGDIVAVRYTEHGKFVAPFMGQEPTGKTYEVVAMEWFEMRSGKIAARWGARDSAAISRQVGMKLG
jgi:ketosteroid isomerase-like protein